MRYALWFIFSCISLPAPCQSVQTYNLDSLRLSLRTAKEDTSKVWLLINLGRNFADSDSMLTLSEQAIDLSRRLQYTKGEADANNNIGYWYNQHGDYAKALSYYLTAVKLAEKSDNGLSLKRSYNSMSTVYLYFGNFIQAQAYSRQAHIFAKRYHDREIESLSNAYLSKSFIAMDQIDSATKYAEESYRVARAFNRPFPLYNSSSCLSEIALHRKDGDAAIKYSLIALKYSLIDARAFRVSGANLLAARAYELVGKNDSVRYYAQKAFEVAELHRLNSQLLGASLLLSKLTEGNDNTISFKYYKRAMIAKDSLFSQEKNQSIAMLTLEEDLRQEELLDARRAAELVRTRNIQYAGIAFGVIVFAIVLMIFSQSAHANEKTIRFLTALAMLVIFEFLNLLLDPFVSGLTRQMPLLMLLALVIIAASLIPVHQWLEQQIHHKLIIQNARLKR